MKNFLIIYSILLLIFSSINGHFHETQLPKSYGHIHQLQPPILNLSYSSSSLSNNNNDDQEEINIPVTITMDATTTIATNIGDESFTQRNDEDDLMEQSFNNNNNNVPPNRSNVIQYIWNVYNFSDILSSEQELIFSPRFYLSEPGYRLQMLLITNTTYSDLISYLGVFFRIVAGDYDSEVEWPYKYRTILSVIKHEELDDWTTNAILTGNFDNNKIHTKYNHTIIPNIDECRLRSAFLRPNSDIEYSSNADGCGNRRHIPLWTLKSENYLKDDTLILLLTVYLENDIEEKTFHKALMSMRYNELVSNYLWTIDRFSEKKNESISTGKIAILNADPFYTHPNGYLIQLFLTILPKRNAFAISIAFVQGDHDRYLQWPFPYPFEMAIVDQSPDYWKRDLSIKVKPSKSDCGTEPFSQPGSQPEFCFLTIQSLQVLSLTHYNFLLDDTLKIRFTTRFERYSSRQRSSILLRNNRLVSEFNWLLPGLVARFQRYISEQQQSNNNGATSRVTTGKNNNHTSSSMKTHRFVSDEFYTNGQGYLCQLVLTVSIKTISTKSNSIIDTNNTIDSLPSYEESTQEILLFSLELVIIEGEYDRFLDWPFNNAYELAIVGYKNLVNPADQISNNGGGGDGGQFYFDESKSQQQQQPKQRTNSKLIVPIAQIENGLCSKESFQKPIKQNPPCGIKEFVQMDLSSDRQQMMKSAKEMTMNSDGRISNNNPQQQQQNNELGSLSKTDEDLHLRVRIYL
ncbi:hypothetical protein DERP_014925 [Dermatophagoides pteronyssinus]|uniref:MATH domain-containing protein n=1 Tax=Dermatophagoides pteronyssinus TaxID=6956 RepID=A0ABQ8JWM0_DERPT|nr:hypothetical protein DERP_014925 [Dermatophagoides pteronyssinus]